MPKTCSAHPHPTPKARRTGVDRARFSMRILKRPVRQTAYRGTAQAVGWHRWRGSFPLMTVKRGICEHKR